MITVEHINYAWNVDRYSDPHWLVAGHSYVEGKGVLYLKLTPWQPRMSSTILKVWTVRNAPAKVDALARFLGTLMAEFNVERS